MIQTLRGRLHGREVTIIGCGESHEDALDLTRSKGIVEATKGWRRVKPPKLEVSGDDNPPETQGFDPEEAISKQGGLTLEGAKSWAERLIDKMEDDSDEEDEVGAYLVYEPQGGAKARGIARLFSEDTEWSPEYPLANSTTVLEWADMDQQAYEYNQRRLKREDIPLEEYDALIADRKLARAAEKLELFDDWLIRQAKSGAECGLCTHLVIEAPVSTSEVEFHVEPDAPAAIAAAHDCLRLVELDSDEDSDEANDPNDGTGSFLDYLTRRVQKELSSSQIHAVDPRELGDDENQMDKLHTLLQAPLPPDADQLELDAANAEFPVAQQKEEKEEKELESRGPPKPESLPSWEAYFGAASELLYYSPHIRADYTPFLAKCVGSPDGLGRFFDALYFGTVPDAVKALRDPESKETRSFSRLRSLVFQTKGRSELWRRPGDHGVIPVKMAPLDRYLKAKGSDPPRTWVSGIAHRLQQAGANDVVSAARQWFAASVKHLLADPKDNDPEGDYFIAWLRECHRNIYDDIDTSDPAELKSLTWAESEEHPGSKKHRYNIKDIRMPNYEAAFSELSLFDATAPATKRQRVLAKVIVDIFQLRMVDLASILRIADIATSAPAGSRIVIVYYAGVDHVRSITEFWTSQGFSHKGLEDEGLVGKEDWEDDEPRGLDLPSYLHDFSNLFPVDS